MKKKSLNALVEALKESLRLGIITLVGWLIQEGVALLVEEFGAKLTVEQKAMLSGGLIYGLRALDKWLHEIGKKTPLDFG